MSNSSGVFLLYGGLILAVRLLGARVPDRIGPVKAGTIATATSAAGLLIMASVAEPAALYAGTVVFSIGMSFLYPAMLTLALTGLADNERGSAVGTVSSFFDAVAGDRRAAPRCGCRARRLSRRVRGRRVARSRRARAASHDRRRALSRTDRPRRRGVRRGAVESRRDVPAVTVRRVRHSAERATQCQLLTTLSASRTVNRTRRDNVGMASSVRCE